MKNKNEFIYALIGFTVFVLIINMNSFYMTINSKLNKDVIFENYNEILKNNYEELLKYHNISESNDTKLIISKIKYRNIYEFKNEITIYKGYKDGIFLGDAVFTNEGLVGVVNKTYEHESIVELITNKNSEISVSINDSYGILKYENDVVVNNLNNYDNVLVGDKIYTSGIGNLPKSILIGTVSEVNLNNTGIEKVVKVSLSANINEINYVFVYGVNHD